MAHANDLVLKDREVQCEVVHHEDLPVLKITIEKITGYLTAFRGYRMQVSDTVSGIGDSGSTTVIGFGNIILAQWPDTDSRSSLFAENMTPVRGILYDLAFLAIHKWCNSLGIKVPMAFKFEPAMEEWLVDTINWLTEKARAAVRPKPVDRPFIGG